MNINIITDTHGGEFPERWRHEADCDVILHLGDFSDSGRLAGRFFDSWRPTGIPLYFVSGNHESNSLCRGIKAKYDGAICLDYSWVVLGDVLLVGLGGYDIFSSGRKYNMNRFIKRLRESGIVEAVEFSILLTHEPPWPWEYAGEVRGDLNIREFVREFGFNLVLAGHWHEEKPRIERSDNFPPVVNPGITGCCLQIKDGKCKTWGVAAG